MVDRLLNTVSILRDIEADNKNDQLLIHASILDVHLTKLSLSTIEPINSVDRFATERESILRYVASIREMVSAVEGGNKIYAQKISGDGITQEFIRNLRSVERYWECGISQETHQTKESPTQNNFERFGGGEIKAEANKIHSSGVMPIKVVGSQSSFNNLTLSQVTINSMVLSPAFPILFLLIIILMSAASVPLFFRRKEKREVWDTRHSLFLSVRAKVKAVEFRVALVDLSMSGAKIEHDDLIEGNPLIKIYVAGRWRSGQVKWSNSAYAGVLFSSLIEAEKIHHLVYVQTK